MPHRRSRAKETGSVVIGGATVGLHHVGIDEVTHCSRENEKIIGTTVCGTATDHYHPGKSNGSHVEATTCAG
jgi:hypothetical protein